MKKVYLFISLMLSALAVGCGESGTDEQKPVGPGTNSKVVVTVNATLPGDLTWEVGDKVAINGLESEAIDEQSAGTATAAFSLSGVEAPLVVVAPYQILTGLNEVSLPATQSYSDAGFDRTAYAMAGIAPEATPVSEEDDKNLVADVELTPVVGVVTLPLTLDSATASEPVLIKSISFTAESGAAINGTWGAEATTVTDPESGVVSYDIVLNPVTNSATTVLNCGEGVEINASAPTYFGLVVPAGVYTGGFEVVVTDTMDHNFILELSEDVAVERGANLELAPSLFTVVEKAPATLSVTIGEQGIVWNEGDAVVCNNTLSTNTVDAAAAGTATASFSFDAVAYPYSVFYPADYYTTSGSLRFYEEQLLVKNGYDKKMMVMAGYSTTNEVTLTNLCGVVSIPLTNLYEGEVITLDKVEIATSEGDPIAGKYHINYRTGALTTVAGKSAVTLVPSADAPVTIEPNETITVNMVVPKGAIRNGLIVNIHSSVGIVENHKIFPTGVTVRGGETTTADAYVYQEIKIDAIRTAEELIDFAKCVNIGRYKKYVNENGEVVLGNDIDMSGVTEWVPIVGAVDETTGLNTGFNGIFNGQGFSIINWTTTQPLFGYLGVGGVVKNLVIANSCNLVIPELSTYTLDGKPGSNACFGFVVATNLYGTVEGVTNNADVTCNCPTDTAAQSRGAIVGYNAPGAYVRSCVNNGAVTITLANHTAQTGYIGTVVGRSASGPDFVPSGVYDCENNGDLTININDALTSKNFYIGGVTGSSNSYTVTSGCKNTGDITFNTAASGAMVCMGGVTSYSAGEIKDCTNEGNVSLLSTGLIKGTGVAGIAGYQNGPITNCENKGAITVTGTYFAGQNSLGSYASGKTYDNKTASISLAGIVAYAYSSDGSPFHMDNCNNSGKISMTATEFEKTTSWQRYFCSGIVGSSWGDITNCKNTGDVEALYYTSTKEPLNQNCMLYVGGIMGSDFHALSQSESSIIDCVNEGNITVYNDGYKSNSAVGGVVGWPGKESDCTNQTIRCINRGNIVLQGNSKTRIGGIMGGSGSLIDCENYGMVTIDGANSATPVGGINGFHSGGYALQGCINEGDIIANVPVTGAGGMIGHMGNAAHAAGKVCGGRVKCLVKAPASPAGMILGNSAAAAKETVFGTEESPIAVGGTLTIGETSVVMDATSVADPLVLLGSGATMYDPAYHTFYTNLAQ
ncbi:MAG: hypothetical protein IJX65_03420 [Alistipes sp.]|nr:hypothetical protein [Alistipes sp.]